MHGTVDSFWSEAHLAADQRVVSVAVSTVVCAGDEHMVEEGSPGNDKI